MKRFIDGTFDPLEFSYDFPVNLINANEGLKSKNKQLYELLNEDMPEICANYEPDDVARQGEPDLLDEEQFRRKVKEVYEKANRFI